MAKALVFPGQGSQFVGMGKALALAYPNSRQVFEEVDEALGEKLSEVIWEGDMDTLTLTRNAQPALMATSMAALNALEAEGVALDKVSLAAGHSLGEYSALCAAGSMSLDTAARLLRIRGEAMQDAVSPGQGAMAAIIGLGIEEVSDIAKEASKIGICEAANDNDPKQVVVSGQKAAVEAATEIAKSRGARRAIILPVSAPFHCTLMEPAAQRMRSALDESEILEARFPVISNVRAEPMTFPSEIVDALVRQITGMVRWRESVNLLAKSGVVHALEIGPGNVLTGLIRRTEREINCSPVGNPDEVRNAAPLWTDVE